MPIKPVCGHCREEITGVVPVWRGQVPICRDCAYGKFTVRHDARGSKTEKTAAPKVKKAASSRIRSGTGIFVILLGLVVIGLQMNEFAVAVGPEGPRYRGAAVLDAKGEKCISNLWKITTFIQDGSLQWPDLNCPAAGSTYIIEHLRQDTVVSCPDPGGHGVQSIKVSRAFPVPEVEL